MLCTKIWHSKAADVYKNGMGLSFIKMHGLGNDFVITDCRADGRMPDQAMIELLTDRKRGVGCDQLIPLMPPEDPAADVYMRILNADGLEVGACGNATRCVADYIMQEKGKDKIVIQTQAGLLHCTRAENGQITADMGIPKLEWQDIPVAFECDTLHLPVKSVYKLIKTAPVGVNIGNPHAVFFMDEVENIPLHEIGPEIEHNSFFPERVNVEFAKILSRDSIRMRVWERGSGETSACGTGACATAVAAMRRGYVNRQCDIHLNGGVLNIYWRETDGHVLMTGPVAYVYKGTIL
jgi:diaminopimelate epimerase